MSKIKVSALLLSATFGLVITSANAQTLDSLITKQREAMIEEANKNGSANKGIPNASAVPQQLQISQTEPQITHLPALPAFGMPGAAIISEPPAPKPITKAVFNIAEAQVVAIYGVGEDLTAEIAYNGYVGKAQKKNEVIDGWVVQEITGKSVLLSKVVQKGKSVSTISHILRYNQGTGAITTQTITPKIPKPKKTQVKRVAKAVEIPVVSADGGGATSAGI